MENENIPQPAQPISQEVPSPSHNNKFIIVAAIILVLVIIGGVSYFLGAKSENKAPVTTPEPTPKLLVISPLPSPTPSAPLPTFRPPSTSSPSPVVQNTPSNPNIKTYTSNNLKVSFDYSLKQTGISSAPLIKELGNKIYIYQEGTKAEDGQYIEIFNKSASDSIETAIQKQFLTGISDKDCFVENTTSKYKYPSPYQVREISYPVDQNSEIPIFMQGEKCPQTYTQSNGISFFLYNPNHPTIYAFLSIGQYGISADQGKMWQDTISFLN